MWDPISETEKTYRLIAVISRNAQPHRDGKRAAVEEHEDEEEEEEEEEEGSSSWRVLLASQLPVFFASPHHCSRNSFKSS